VKFNLSLCLTVLCLFLSEAGLAQSVSAPPPQTGTIIGTVFDLNEDVVSGATVALEGPSPSDRKSILTNDNGFFHFDQVNPATPYHVSITAKGFEDWTSPEVTLKPGQYFEVDGIHIRLQTVVTSVDAIGSTEEIARLQVAEAEKQRVLGIIPNFYTVYDHNPVPLTPKLKFRLALRTSTDAVTFLGAVFVASVDHAADTPNYGQGWGPFGQRVGANYANGLTDIMIGGAVLPTILHQDPRYFYKGTGTTKARVLYALRTPFVCKGDNGQWQPNYSGLGGYLASGAIANTYYPPSNRGPGLVFSTTFIDIGADMANGLLQEFLLKRLTPSVKNRN
jgi:Carboxypeptidase regulatory-like domain